MTERRYPMEPEDNARAYRNLDLALERLQRQAASNAPFGSRLGAEQKYAQAYDYLVCLGLRPKLRIKYRQGMRS